jgi:ADP-heptose:LPS heptosyltransferase
MHEVHRHLTLFQYLGVPPAGEDLEFPLTAADRAEARDLVRGRYAVLHPGATSTSRRWPVGRWAAVGDALVRRGLPVLVTGVPGEEELTAAVVDGMAEPARDVCGATSLGGFAAVLAGASVLASTDTGAAHLAIAVGTPTVTVFLSGDPRRWAGLRRDRHRVARVDVGCNPCPHLDCPIDHRCAGQLPVAAVLRQLSLL